MTQHKKYISSQSPLLLYNGQIKQSIELKKGDVLIGINGNPITVTNVLCKQGDLFSITPVNGVPILVSNDHKLMLHSIETNKKIQITVNNYLKLRPFEQKKLYTYKTILNNPLPPSNVTKTMKFFVQKFPTMPELIDIFIATNDIPIELQFTPLQFRCDMICEFIKKIATQIDNVYKLNFTNWIFANKFVFIARSIGFRVFLEAIINNDSIVVKENINGKFIVSIVDEGFVDIPEICNENVENHQPLLSEFTVKKYGTGKYIEIDINDENFVFVDCTVL
jgi:hypothetical protein